MHTEHLIINTADAEAWLATDQRRGFRVSGALGKRLPALPLSSPVRTRKARSLVVMLPLTASVGVLRLADSWAN